MVSREKLSAISFQRSGKAAMSGQLSSVSKS